MGRMVQGEVGDGAADVQDPPRRRGRGMKTQITPHLGGCEGFSNEAWTGRKRCGRDPGSYAFLGSPPGCNMQVEGAAMPRTCDRSGASALLIEDRRRVITIAAA